MADCKIKCSTPNIEKTINEIESAQLHIDSIFKEVNNYVTYEKRTSGAWIEENVNSYKTTSEEKENGSFLDSLGNVIIKYITVFFYTACCGPTCNSISAAQEAQRLFNNNKITEYNGVVDSLMEETGEIVSKVSTHVAKLDSMFTKIKKAVESFEKGEIALYEDMLENAEDSVQFEKEYSVVNTPKTHGKNQNIDVIAWGGFGTSAIALKDTVNSLVTESKYGTSSQITTELYIEKYGITDEKVIKNLRIDAANKSHNNTIIARDSGLVSITNSSQMAEAYKEYLGVEVSEEEVGARIESDFKSLIEEETGMSYDEFEDMVKDVSDVYGVNSVVAGSLITSVGLAATGGIKLNTDDFTEEEKKAINESKIAAGDTPEEFGDIIATKKEPTDTVVDIQETLTGSLNSNSEQIIDQIVEEDDSFVEEVSEEVVSEPNAIVPPVQEESSSPVIAEVDEKPPVELDSYDKVVVSDDVADDIKDKIGDLAEANPPEELEKEKVTSEDVDNQARDEYYASKTPDQLASDRNKAIEEFDKMPTEVKVKALEGMGYTTTVAAALAADQVKGQAAYIRGLEEQQLAMISNNIASNQGVNNHDTVFDNGHDMSYVESGQVNKDLTPTSQKVQTARQQLTNAKNNYDNSVTEANDSIDKAKKAKEKYNQTLKKIKDTSGEDPKKWTTEQIDEYNSVAKDYNEAIVDVNKAVSNVDSKKAEYETQKDNYNAACEEYNQFAAEELEKGQEGNILAEEQNVATGNDNNITDDMFTDALGQPQSGENEGSKPVSDIQNVSDNIELSQDKDPVIIFTDSVTYEDEKKEE